MYYKCIISVREVHNKCIGSASKVYYLNFQELCEWDIIEHIAEWKLLPENTPGVLEVHGKCRVVYKKCIKNIL